MAQLGLAELSANIVNVIKDNSTRDISGDDLQQILIDMRDSLGTLPYNPSIAYILHQSIIFTEASVARIYTAIAGTAPGESPSSTPSKWQLAGANLSPDGVETSIAGLRARTNHDAGSEVLLSLTAPGESHIYSFDGASTDADNGTTIIKPDDIDVANPGRWLRGVQYITENEAGDNANLITDDKTLLVNAINEIAKNGSEPVQNITALKNIPLARRDFKIVSVEFYDEASEGATSGGATRYLFFTGTDTSDGQWQNLANWNIIQDLITGNTNDVIIKTANGAGNIQEILGTSSWFFNGINFYLSAASDSHYLDINMDATDAYFDFLIASNDGDISIFQNPTTFSVGLFQDAANAYDLLVSKTSTTNGILSRVRSLNGTRSYEKVVRNRIDRVEVLEVMFNIAAEAATTTSILWDLNGYIWSFANAVVLTLNPSGKLTYATDHESTLTDRDIPDTAYVNKVSGNNGLNTITITATVISGFDLGLGRNFKIDLDQNATMTLPLNRQSGQTFTLEIRQDATGSRVITWGTGFLQGTDAPIDISTTANAYSFVTGYIDDNSDAVITSIKDIAQI